MTRKKLNLAAFQKCQLSQPNQIQLKGGRKVEDPPSGVGGGSFIGSSIDIRNDNLNTLKNENVLFSNHSIF